LGLLNFGFFFGHEVFRNPECPAFGAVQALVIVFFWIGPTSTVHHAFGRGIVLVKVDVDVRKVTSGEANGAVDDETI